MKIESLKFSGFKYIHETEIKEYIFSEHNTISGDNCTGKTTIAEALCWVFCGCNIDGHYMYEKYLLNNSSQRMWVEAEFIDNKSVNHILKRQTEGVSTILLDGQKITQEQLNMYILNKDIFMSVFLIGFFEKFSALDARKFLTRIIPSIKLEEILKCMSPFDASIIDTSLALNSTSIIKNKRSRLKELEKERTFLNSQLVIIENDTLSTSNNIDTINSNRKDFGKLIQAKHEINSRLDKINTETWQIQHNLSSISMFNELKVNYINNMITKMFNKVYIKFEDFEVETGETISSFNIFYENREYSYLSKSEKIKANIEISNFINHSTGINAPIFIDNAECVSDLEIPNTQFFEVYTKKGCAFEVINK